MNTTLSLVAGLTLLVGGLSVTATATILLLT
jgi:hypothetical protein